MCDLFKMVGYLKPSLDDCGVLWCIDYVVPVPGKNKFDEVELALDHLKAEPEALGVVTDVHSFLIVRFMVFGSALSASSCAREAQEVGIDDVT